MDNVKLNKILDEGIDACEKQDLEKLEDSLCEIIHLSQIEKNQKFCLMLSTYNSVIKDCWWEPNPEIRSWYDRIDGILDEATRAYLNDDLRTLENEISKLIDIPNIYNNSQFRFLFETYDKRAVGGWDRSPEMIRFSFKKNILN